MELFMSGVLAVSSVVHVAATRVSVPFAET